MVKYQSPDLDRTFAALADPTRRALLAQLEAESLSVTALAKPLPMSLPAVMKHLDVLAAAGLIARRKTGRTVRCSLTARPMEDAVAWLERYRRFWSGQLDRLAAFLEEDACPPKPLPLSNPALPSSDASPRRRKDSTPPGRSRKK